MIYRPTHAECIALFHFVNAIALDGVMIIPKIVFPKNMPKGVWGQASAVKGKPGCIEMLAEYPSYIQFIKTFVHEIGHVWVAKVKGNTREVHGKNFKEYVEIIKSRLNGLDVSIIVWTTTLNDPRIKKENKNVNKKRRM